MTATTHKRELKPGERRVAVVVLTLVQNQEGEFVQYTDLDLRSPLFVHTPKEQGNLLHNTLVGGTADVKKFIASTGRGSGRKSR